MIVAPRKVKGSCGNIRVWIVLLLNWQTRGPTGFKNILSNRTSTADLISLSFYSLCWNVINTVCVSVCVCALPCLVRHAGRKLLVQGKERSWADGQPAHRLSCSQELISLSPTPWVARNTHTHTCTHSPTAWHSRGWCTWLSCWALGRRDVTSAPSPPGTAANIKDFNCEDGGEQRALLG